MAPTMETTGADYCSTCAVYWFSDGPAICIGTPEPDLATELEAWNAIAAEYGPIMTDKLPQ